MYTIFLNDKRFAKGVFYFVISFVALLIESASSHERLATYPVKTFELIDTTMLYKLLEYSTWSLYLTSRQKHITEGKFALAAHEHLTPQKKF